MNEIETHQRLMLHFGERGPVELEVWNEQTESATTITSTWATDPSEHASRTTGCLEQSATGRRTESKDITRQLHRAGFKLVPIDQ